MPTLAVITSRKPSPSPSLAQASVYGETDKTASNVITEKTTASDFNATIAAAMGLPHDQILYSPNKRPFKMGGKTGKPITDVLA
jgi:hypothetical protein